MANKTTFAQLVSFILLPALIVTKTASADWKAYTPHNCKFKNVRDAANSGKVVLDGVSCLKTTPALTESKISYSRT